MYAQTYIPMHMHMSMSISLFMSMYKCLLLYWCMYIYMYIILLYIYIYIYIYLFIDIQTWCMVVKLATERLEAHDHLSCTCCILQACRLPFLGPKLGQGTRAVHPAFRPTPRALQEEVGHQSRRELKAEDPAICAQEWQAIT